MLLAERVGSLILTARPEPIGLMRLRKVACDIVARLAARARRSCKLPSNTITEHLSSRGLQGSEASPEARDRAVTSLELDGRIVFSTDLRESLMSADIIVTATSSVNGIISAEMLRPGAVVCEISRPFNISEDVRKSRSDVLVVDGGLVLTPGEQDLGVGVGLPKGIVYGCMAETMVMSLEKRYQHGSIGPDLDPSQILELQEQACRHGFAPAPLMTSGRRVQPEDWTRLISCRRTPCAVAGEA
jgi:hypothetical protein